MEQALGLDEFLREPVGRWILAGTTVVWCHSPTLAGAVCWGRPDVRAAQETLRAYEGYRRMPAAFDAIVDGSAIEMVLPEAIFAVVDWLRVHRDELTRRVRRQIAIAPLGVDGLALSGVAPQAGATHHVQYVSDAGEAFRLLLPDGGERLHQEVGAIVAAARAVPGLLIRLRALLRAHEARLTLAAAARELGLSSRQMQRELVAAGSSFRGELLDARFACITRRLSLGDDKISAVAADLGITKTSLAALVRERTGRTPAEYRAALQTRR